MFINKLSFSFPLVLLVSLLHLASPGYAEGKGSDEEAGSPSSRSVQVRSAQYLSTPEEHSNFLIDALNSAKKSVMICSYNLDPRHLLEKGIARALKNAADKSVKIYIYYAKSQSVYPMIDAHLQQLGKFCARLEETSNHAKCVVKDKECVAIGSHDWLAKPCDGSLNASWVISGNIARNLSDSLWDGVRYHQSLAYGNARGEESFLGNEDNFCFGQAEFDHEQTFYAMGTPEAHHQFLESEVFGKTQRDIILCSPFIRLERLKEVLSERRLKDLKRRNVRLSVVTLPNPCNLARHERRPIFEYLEYLKENFGNFSFRTQEGLHAKSVIGKDLLLAGSFNWLSAVDSSDHQANNNEFSIAISGAKAREEIQKLRQNPQWQLDSTRSSVAPEEGRQKRKREEGEAHNTKRRRLSSSETSSSLESEDSSSERSSSFDNEDSLSEEDSSSERSTSSESEESSSEEEEIPERFLNQIQVFPDNRGNRGYCVCRFGKYLKGRRGILYFSTSEEAAWAAYQTWG